MTHIFSVDLEDWFCASIFSHQLPPCRWGSMELRIVDNTRRLLDLLSRHSIEATFFVLGWIAQRVPDLIREIDAAGHELATHGYAHQLVTTMTEEDFRDDLVRALSVMKTITSQPIVGYRAPTFTITSETLWATDILASCGIKYDSSVFPMSLIADYTKIPGLSADPFVLPNGLVEVPIGCADYWGFRIPFAGGMFFRILPLWFTKAMLRRCSRQNRSIMFYIHPWEIDPGQPRMTTGKLQAVRHYTNLDKTLDRLDELFSRFTFTSARKVLGL